MRIAVVGAGMAGLSCAGRLAASGHMVELFDKGRRPGGRMSTRRLMTTLGEASFDHGAQYFTARDAGFQAQVNAWHHDGIVAPWPAAGPDCWVGTPGMDTPLQHFAQAASVHWNTRADRLTGTPGDWTLRGDGRHDGPFEAVLFAVPAENATMLLDTVAPAMAAFAAATPAQPCWTLMAAFTGRVATADDVLREDGPIGWAARNSAKPGRTGPEAWVIQAGPGWSQDHLEQAQDEIVAALLAAFSVRVGTELPPVLSASAHRWRYARSGNAGLGMVWDRSLQLGLCGDWLLGPRVECAWLSGSRLGEAVAAHAVHGNASYSIGMPPVTGSSAPDM